MVKIPKAFPFRGGRRACAAPKSLAAPLGLFLAEAGADKLLQLRHDGRSIVTLSSDPENGSLPSGKHHESHDALSIHALAILLDPNFGTKTAGGLNEESGRPGMKTVPVLDGEILGGVCSVWFRAHE